ncbi:MAG: hypothetical protein ABIP03_08755 [Aquihabitans sp.]
MTNRAPCDGGVTTGPRREFGCPNPFRDPALPSAGTWTHEMHPLTTDLGDLNNLTDLHAVVAAREALERAPQDVLC